MDHDAQDSAVLHAILDAAVDAIIVSDETGKMLRANPAACQLFQYDASELIGQSVNMLMPSSTASMHDAYMSHHLTTGEERIIGIGREVEGRAKDGSIFPVHLSVAHTQVSGTRMFVGILHDLTHRKATEDALARSQRLDAIGQMTGGIVHDFNNLLTVVIGNLELLETRGPRDDQRSSISDALSSAELGADLTSRLMVFARQSKLEPVKADLRELCEDILAILKRTLGSACQIKTEFAEDVTSVMIDPGQLQSALVNLAINARDAMNGRGELLVSIADVTIDDSYMAQEMDMEPGEYVRLSVSDDGAGMSVEAQKRAFEPYYTTKSESGGTGLGLAMVYGFVRQSGGHITLYSELGLGTSFGLYFPVARDDEDVPTGTPVEDRKAPLPKGHGETVLVVEDNPKVRELSVARIGDLGFQTIAAENGDEAFRILKSGVKVDLVFSDLVMPGELNGYELAAKVVLHFPETRVLLTSGYASDVVTGSVPHSQSYELLHKPYRQSDLAKRLQALFAGAEDD